MIAATLAAGLSFVSGATVRWQCDRNSRVQRIYFGNHSSHLDFIVIWSALPTRARRLARPVARSSYWEQGVVRRYLAGRIFCAVLIQPAGESGDAAAARASVTRMANEMGDRHSLIVFPEGTRSRDGQIGTFKSGLFHLSRLRPDAELIPVYLKNLNRILPKGEILPVPILPRVVFGPPLHRILDEDKHDFLTRAREAVVQLR